MDNILDYAIVELMRMPVALTALLETKNTHEMLWRPENRKWCLLEILAHLADEEKEDFCLRMRLLVEEPGVSWPGIDPEAWVTDRRYRDRNPAECLKEFCLQRKENAAWLRELDSAKLSRRYEHPALGAISAGDLLASWVAHDRLHLKQLMETSTLYLRDHATPYSTAYAMP